MNVSQLSITRNQLFPGINDQSKMLMTGMSSIQLQTPMMQS